MRRCLLPNTVTQPAADGEPGIARPRRRVPPSLPATSGRTLEGTGRQPSGFRNPPPCRMTVAEAAGGREAPARHSESPYPDGSFAQ